MLRRAWQRYCELLVTKPLITKAATGGTLFGLGDVLGQALDGSIERGQYDPARTLRAVVWSAAGFTPIAHAWYIKVLDRRVPGTTPKAVISKVALDQLLFAPFINAVRPILRASVSCIPMYSCLPDFVSAFLSLAHT